MLVFNLSPWRSTHHIPLFIVLLPFFLLSSYIDTAYTVQTVHMDDDNTFIWRVYCRGIPCPDTWGHGYQINDFDNDFVNNNGGGSGSAVATV